MKKILNRIKNFIVSYKNNIHARREYKRRNWKTEEENNYQKLLTAQYQYIQAVIDGGQDIQLTEKGNWTLLHEAVIWGNSQQF